jgi:quercetin 2,3-dioxygenase
MNNIKQVEKVYTESHPNMVGDGFRVYNAFPGGNRLPLNRLSPFFLLDYGAPHYFPPTKAPRGVDEHPHRGFETVTIAYQGSVSHRDSGGNSGVIGEGDIQWMTAASGVVHEEKHEKNFSENGGIMEMVQLWVNLPKAHKMDAPRYQTLLKKDIPVVSLTDNGSYLRVIAGNYENVNGIAKTFSPVNMYDVWLKAGDEIPFTLPENYSTALYVREGGQLLVNTDHTAASKNLVVMENKGEIFTVKAVADSGFLVLNGEPLHEPIVSYGPFVMNTKEEISQAIIDYQEGKMGHLN